MFGLVQEVPQSETTALYPRSPYECEKVYTHHMTINYSESYDIFGSSGILFNHESPLRGLEFVTRKITDGLARIKLGKQTQMELGNLEAKRDWRCAKDYVDDMWRMLQTDKPDVYMLATGRTETIRQFIEISSHTFEIEIAWEGQAEKEIGIDANTGKEIIKINSKYYRPAEVDLLIGNSAKAKAELGWKAQITLEELCAMMIKPDLDRINQGGSF